ncbi:MAG TPA: hypothetical protein VMB85_26635 [Bryobacteraceae bacterium]|nr:hypothetical protein [Bryobacteraceae bacterium]
MKRAERHVRGPVVLAAASPAEYPFGDVRTTRKTYCQSNLYLAMLQAFGSGVAHGVLV